MSELLKHIESLNAHADLMMEQEPGLWMSKWTDDLSHWNDMGIFNVEDFERNAMINNISDASKELYGCRLRMEWDELTLDELKKMYDNIVRQLNEQFEAEKEAEALAAEWKKGLPDNCEPLPYEEYAYLEAQC